MNEIKITIFTPTFNRSNNLVECYESLKKQKCYSFIWQIIDDGSTDDTEVVVNSWLNNPLFKIEYIKVPNGGKCRAINKSLKLTETELWLCLDSDDTLVEDAVGTILTEYSKIEKDASICGLFSLRGKDNLNSMQGTIIPRDMDFCRQKEIRYTLGIPPEYSHVFKTNIIKNYYYPCVKGENYFPLSYVFDQVDIKYKYKVIHNPIMICDYRVDGLTKNKRNVIIKNPVGYSMYKKQLVALAPNKKEKAKAVVTYITGCLLAKKNPLRSSDFKLLTLFLFPVGLVDYLLRYKLGFVLDFEIKTKKIN
ncbi:glycosyltransferase family A protein [Pseudoalteromonas sp. P1-7a]|uniref:glycosyltransferase family A protein n=1 Tax=Pseudoalteromonas sp. P1-7a TaxID=1723755 RepID=UPI0006D675DB|nr:glycosyltransferase family A protein [Pseudoalteromonas sp. P1-7a]KPZ53593.1 Hyaluronan synthase [Pseudoalteromonas sp. P1-7a]